MAAVAGALHDLHKIGLLHRDIKPSNIGFTGDGTPKLLDFGVAELLLDVEWNRRTDASERMGFPPATALHACISAARGRPGRRPGAVLGFAESCHRLGRGYKWQKSSPRLP